MKKVGRYEDVGVGEFFIANAKLQFKVLDLKDFSKTSAPIMWKDLPVGSKYYEVDSFAQISHEFPFGGRGSAVLKITKDGEDSFNFGAMTIKLIAQQQFEKLCYPALERSPVVVAIKKT